MNLDSIRTKVILLFIPLIVIPLLLIGIGGSIYYQNVLKQNVWDSEQAQARSTANYVDSYMSSSILYLESYSTRVVIIADLEQNKPHIDNPDILHQPYTSGYDSLYVMNISGKVVANYPGASQVGQDFSDRPYVAQVLATQKPVVIGPIRNETGEPTIYVGVPIKNENGTFLGVIAGALDPDVIAGKILDTPVSGSEYIYLVNGSGNIIVHKNRTYMENILDFSSIPAVQNVFQGNEGVMEYYNSIEGENRLGAYSPIPDLGWGVIVAVPKDVAYAAVNNTLWPIVAITLFLLAISLALAYLFSKSVIDPILGLYDAARAITRREDYLKYLPFKRKDEIGQVAICMDKMAQRLTEDRERIMEEKDKAELYLDIMGHDINNLNQSVLGNLELIREESNLTAEEKESIEKSIVATQSSASIIRNVRSMQHISEEGLGFEVMDIDGLIQASIRESPRPGDKKITINYSPKKGRFVMCVPLLKEVFSNLINNSIKYSGPEVTIDIVAGDTVMWNKKYYTVEVSDNGIGIPDDVKPRLFNRFQRGTTKAHGKGLGLYIVKSLLEKCDGSVKVEDRVPGDHTKGTKFTVAILAAEEMKNGKL